MYEKFLEEVGNFIFMEDQPELADIIFVPGNSYRKILRSDRRNREI